MRDHTASQFQYLRTATQIIMADLYTFLLVDGSAIRYTSAQEDISVRQTNGDALIWKAKEALITNLRTKVSVGLDIDEQTLKIAYKAATSDSPTLINGAPFAVALANGMFDGAYLMRDRVILPAWGGAQPIGNGEIDNTGNLTDGRIKLAAMRISTIDSIGPIEAQVKVKSELVLLDIDFPRNLWQTSCVWTLFGFGCNINKVDFAFSGTVGAFPTTSIIPWASAEDNVFDQGTLTFNSGVLKGQSVTITHSDGTRLLLRVPLGVVPSEGDNFTAYLGCDHTTGSNGCLKFDNLEHFRGYPDVPPVQTGI